MGKGNKGTKDDKANMKKPKAETKPDVGLLKLAEAFKK